ILHQIALRKRWVLGPWVSRILEECQVLTIRNFGAAHPKAADFHLMGRLFVTSATAVSHHEGSAWDCYGLDQRHPAFTRFHVGGLGLHIWAECRFGSCFQFFFRLKA